MSKYTTKTERVMLCAEDNNSLAFVSILDEGGGPYLAISTHEYVESANCAEAIYLESHDEIEAFAEQLHAMLEAAGDKR